MEQEIKNDIDSLITKYLANKCSMGEKDQLLELLSSFNDGRSSKELLLKQLNEFQMTGNENQSVDFERIYNDLLNEIQRRELTEAPVIRIRKRLKIRRLVLSGISIAAVFCLAFFLGAIFNRQQNRIISPELPIASGYVEIKAPLGARSEVRLSDGTEVMLNAGSSIKYRSDFNLVHRDLILEGEAYFKVARNTDIPLIVFAGDINIKATGTEFNVKAYSDEGIIETTLVLGEVEISQKGNKDSDHILVLKPNQKAIYAGQSDQLTLERIKEIEPQAIKTAKISAENLMVSSKTDVEQVTAWTKNKLIIRSENLESLCIKLQRKYNVTFIFGDEEIKKHRFSGVLLDETLQQVMDVIKLTSPVDYLIDRKTVLLYAKDEKREKYSTDLNTNKN